MRRYSAIADNELSYSADMPRFLAWPFDTAGGECGDVIIVCMDGQCLDYLALDSGEFGEFGVIGEDGIYRPILADIPHLFVPFDGLSHQAIVINASETRRRLERER